MLNSQEYQDIILKRKNKIIDNIDKFNKDPMYHAQISLCMQNYIDGFLDAIEYFKEKQ